MSPWVFWPVVFIAFYLGMALGYYLALTLDIWKRSDGGEG